MTTPAHQRLNVRERYAVTTYLLKNLDEVWALPTNDARIRHVSGALNLPLTLAKLQTAADAAQLSLSPPPTEKGPRPLSKAELHQLVGQLAERVASLEAEQAKTAECLARANDYSKALEQRICTLEAAAALARTRIPINSYAPGGPNRTTLL
jgi:hypothetical protein